MDASTTYVEFCGKRFVARFANYNDVNVVNNAQKTSKLFVKQK